MKSNKKFLTLLLLSIFTLSACNNQNEISTSTHSDSSSTSKTDSSETSSNSQDSSSTVDSSEELAKLETVLRKYDDLSNWNFDLLFVCDDENPDYSFTTNYNIDGLNYKLTYSLMDYEFVEYLEILENEMFYYYQDYEIGEYIKISSNYEDEFSSVSYLDYFEFGGLSSELFNYQNNKYYVNNDYLNDVGIYIFGYELDYKSISFELTNEEIGKIIASYDDTYNLTSGTYELTLSNHGNVSVTLPEAKEFVVENQTTTLPELNCVEGDLNVALEKFNDSSTYNFNVDLFVLDVEEPDYSYVDHFVYANNVIKYTYGEEYYGADYIDYIETLEDGSKNYYSQLDDGSYTYVNSSKYPEVYDEVNYLTTLDFTNILASDFTFESAEKGYVNTTNAQTICSTIFPDFAYGNTFNDVAIYIDTTNTVTRILSNVTCEYDGTTYPMIIAANFTNHGNASITLPNATEYDESSSGETSNVGTVIFSSTDVSPWTTNATPTGFTANRGVQFTKNGSPSFSFKNTTFAESVNTVSIKLNTNRAEGWIISVTVNGVTYLINGETSYTFTNDDTPSFSDLSVLTFECPETPETGTININFEAVESTTNKSIYINAIGINNPNL